jgi:multimeric flavodoxin WrbA
MKVLALCGSPRANGNTSQLLAVVARELRSQGHSVDILNLGDLAIADCNGCLVCEETECSGDCSIEDDMQRRVVPLLLAADAIILGSPSYFDMPSAQIKRFMDRSNMVLNRITKKGMACALVVVGQSEMASLNAACRALRRYTKICGMKEVRGSPVRVIARDEGDVRASKSAIDEAKGLANGLIAAVRKAT